MLDYLLHFYAFVCVIYFCIRITIEDCRLICFKEMSKLKISIYIVFILSNGYITFVSIPRCFEYLSLFIKTL